MLFLCNRFLVYFCENYYHLITNHFAFMSYRFVLVLTLCFSAMLIFSCTTSSSTPSAPSPSVTPNPQIGQGDKLISLRYERYDKGNSTAKSKVYYLSKNSYNNNYYIYFRKYGSFEGWSYADIDGRETIAKLHKAVSDLHLAKYPFTSLDEQKKNRNRWVLEAKYESGAVISMVVYQRGNATAEEKRIDETLTSIFDGQVKVIPKMGSEHTKYSYNSECEVQREIYYTADDIVHGGWDAEDVMKDFGGKRF